MDIRSSCNRLFLLGLLWASGVTPANAQPIFHPGDVEFALSPNTASTIPIDLSLLASRLCDGQLQPSPTPCELFMAKCHIVVTNGGPVPTGPSGTVGALGPPSLTAKIFGFSSAKAIVTPCGIWDATLTLDPALSQADSPMTFEELPESPGNGVFAGLLEMSSILHLSNRDTGQSADFALRLGLDLAGPWTLDSPESPTNSDLVLFANRGEDGQVKPSDRCNPTVILSSPDELKDFLANGCQICLRPLLPDIAGNP